jgi:hypothetical protein
MSQTDEVVTLEMKAAGQNQSEIVLPQQFEIAHLDISIPAKVRIRRSQRKPGR